MQVKTKRLHYIDAAKGVGVILVVLMHIIFSTKKIR